MPKNQNSASRLFGVFQAVNGQQGNQPTAQAWATALGLEFEDTPAGFGRVARMLALISEELESAHRQMRSTQYSSDIYEPAFNRLRLAIGLDQLRASWSGPQSRLREGDTLTLLKFFSEILPDEGRLVSPEALGQLHELLDTLEAMVEEQDLPEELRTFIAQQVDIIRRALQEYPIVGERAFERAVGEVLIRYPEYREMMEQYKDEEAVSLVEKVWGQVLTWSSRVSALRDLLGAGEGLAGLITSGGQS